MTSFTQYCIDELTIFVRSIRNALWLVAEDAERSRLRLRVRREQRALAAREAVSYRRLGSIGFELLTEQVSITRTPEIMDLLDQTRHCSGAYADREALLESQSEMLSKSDWQRLAHQLAEQQCVIRWIRLSPVVASGQRLDVSTPSGFCVAIKRNERILQVPTDGFGRRGDELLVVAPAAAIPQWEIWAGNSSTGNVV